MLESEAWCSLSLTARRVLDRVMIEHMAHAGSENGNLVVTYDDFVRFGIRRNSLKSAITQTVTKGWLIITEKGRPSVGPDRWPTRYALGWLPRFDGTPALNRWKGWRKAQADVPICGNIKSSSESGTRPKGGNARALVSATLPAPSIANDIGERAEILKTPAAETVPGRKSDRDRSPVRWCKDRKRLVNAHGAALPLVDHPLVGTPMEQEALRASRASPETSLARAEPFPEIPAFLDRRR
jgi:hypothetical protein